MKRMILWITWVAIAVLSGGIGDIPGAHARPFDAAPDPSITSSCMIQAVNGNLAAVPFRYSTSGYCRIDADYNDGGGRNPSSFDNVKQTGEATWTAVGTYNPTTKETTETISVRQITSAAPGYVANGTIHTTMVCAKDPWLQPDGLSCGSASPQTTGYIDPQYKAIYPGNPTLPATSRLTSAQRVALNKQIHDSMPVQPLAGASQSQVWDGVWLFPTVLAPTAGLKIYERTPMPIKLAPPQAWADTQLKLDGTPIKTAQSVAGYRVALQRKDAKGNWNLVVNLSVAANEAQSAQGYMRFGNPGPGYAAAYYSVPGAWRLAAQVASPKESNWSKWTEFTVTPQTVIPFKYGQPSSPFTIKK